MNPGASDGKQKILEFCAARGQMIEKAALEALAGEEHWRELVETQTDPFISAEKIGQALMLRGSKIASQIEVSVKKSNPKGPAADESADFRVMHELEAQSKSKSEGKVNDFLAYFKDKYEFLYSLISRRIGFSPKTADKLKFLPKNDEVDLIGMVVRKWMSKNGNLTMELDSPEGRFVAIISKDDAVNNREAQRILVDDVIGIKGKKFTDELIIAKSFIWPELAQRPLRAARRDLSACLISDVHVGSRLFMRREFSRFLQWINGTGLSQSECERVGKIKYLYIAGDNVDGVGIYPDQYDELEIKDIYGQYDAFADLVAQVPEYIEIFVCPGQHDATRRADPQPPIHKEYAKRLYEMKNVHVVGSPVWIEMEGLLAMMYHGGSFHDMYAVNNLLDNKEPEKAMIEILRRRDISTGFGLNQPYVPYSPDLMVIREEPDFYFGGDMHHKGYANYRGCTVANAGCWQGMTDFQIREGHIPTPGIALDINLKTRKLTENNFLGEEQ